MRVFWRSGMTIAVVAGLGLLLMLGLVLFTVLKLRPDSFSLKVTLTKWLSLDLKMQSKLQPGDPLDQRERAATGPPDTDSLRSS
jgi:hypothetical protein